MFSIRIMRVAKFPSIHASRWPFSRQIVNGNADPASALETVVAKLSFRCGSNFFKYSSNVHTVSENKFCLGSQ